MATKIGNILCRSSHFLQNSVLQENVHVSSLLINYQQNRWRRSTKVPAWFVREKPYARNLDLTAKNKKFLEDLAVDLYKTSSPLQDGPWDRQEYTPRTMRTGVLALKIGVLPQWTKDGKKVYTTLLQVLDNHVIRYKPPEMVAHSAGWKPSWGTKYGMVVVGALSSDPSKYSKNYNNLFAEAGVPPKRKLTRFLVTDNAKVQPGTPLNAMHFRVGDFVDYQAKTISHGFQGVVKRWGMKGGRASHGTTKSHRRLGGIGGGGDKSGVWKGKKMPGNMGDKWAAVKGLRIWRINTKYNVLYVSGPNLPGATHTIVRIMDTCIPTKKPSLESPPPMPTWFPEDETDPILEEYFHEKLFQLSSPSIQFEQEKDK